MRLFYQTAVSRSRNCQTRDWKCFSDSDVQCGLTLFYPLEGTNDSDSVHLLPVSDLSELKFMSYQLLHWHYCFTSHYIIVFLSEINTLEALNYIYNQLQALVRAN